MPLRKSIFSSEGVNIGDVTVCVKSNVAAASSVIKNMRSLTDLPLSSGDLNSVNAGCSSSFGLSTSILGLRSKLRLNVGGVLGVSATNWSVGSVFSGSGNVSYIFSSSSVSMS